MPNTPNITKLTGPTYMDFSALTLSAGVVALAEMGDKTQLLSLMLAARYPRQAMAIIAGIFVATIANHA